MAYEFRFQDASSPSTSYLDEELIAQILDPDVVEVEGIFAFASVAGAVSILGDPAFPSFVSRATFKLLVGLDAVTDRRTLEFLILARDKFNPRFELKVFRNTRNGLFHPKLFRARRADGSGTVVVGSGNFTPGGLRSHLEAYSVFRYPAGSGASVSELDRFLVDHEDEIVDVDDEALERAARNGVRVALAKRAARGAPSGSKQPAGSDEAAIAVEEEVVDLAASAPSDPADRVLVAYVPRAGGRWHQVHFNEPAIREYFRAAPNSGDRVVLYRVDIGGAAYAEPPRPVVFSDANVNHKIEFGAHAGERYPAGGPPILVLREIGLRTHSYVMLLPGEAGYSETDTLLKSLPSIGRGARRAITTLTVAQAAWPGLPI